MQLGPMVAETHTGLVILLGDRAYKVKKPVVTDFLDFGTVERRESACSHEVALNSRLAPDSYLGVGHFTQPRGGAPEPVIVMRRHPDDRRLATMVRAGRPMAEHLAAVAAVLARFHASTRRGHEVDAEARPGAVRDRWAENVAELRRYADGLVPGLDMGAVTEIDRLSSRFIDGRTALFTGRIAGRRIVDGHADLLADDIFCLDDGPALLDCLEFDDRLRYVDVIDDAAFLAMDLEFLGRPDLAELFLRQYAERSGDDAPGALRHFYIAYRAVVRAKVDCVRYAQGHAPSAADAAGHLRIARRHLQAGAVRLILVGGGPGTGKTTLARSLGERIGARVISTDDVRAEMALDHQITGGAGVLDEGLYTAHNVDAVYDAVLSRARNGLQKGETVIVDATWRDARHRDGARRLASQASAEVIEFTCAATLDTTEERIRTRTGSTSQVTPEIAATLAARERSPWPQAHVLDTGRPPAESVADAERICCRTSRSEGEK